MASRAVVGVIASLSALVTACGEQATGQTVAVVNGEEISASELNAELAAANLPESVDKKQVMPQLLNQIIDRRLLAQRAAEQGVDKTPEFVSSQRRLTEQLLIDLSTRRQAGSMKLPTQTEIDAFMLANPGMFNQRAILVLDQLQFETPKGDAAMQRIGATQSMEALARELVALGITYNRGEARLDTGVVPAAMLRRIEELPAGEPFIVPVGGRMFASVVTRREPVVLSPEDSRKMAVEAMRRQNVVDSVQKQVRDLRAKAKIEYQAGYGPGAPKAKAPAPTPGKA